MNSLHPILQLAKTTRGSRCVEIINLSAKLPVAQVRNMTIGTVAQGSKYKDLYGKKRIVSAAYECKRI